MVPVFDVAEYAARQPGRFAWYLGLRGLGRRAARNAPPPPARDTGRDDGGEPSKPRRPAPSFNELLADIARLFRRDLANVAKGVYPAPDDGDGPLAERLARSRMFLADVAPAAARRAGEGRTPVAELKQAKGLPDYYLHDFHYQDGGYLTEESARAYDTQVETLFIGAANAMRRQALVPLVEHFSSHDQRGATLLDIGCGTGRFVHLAKQALPGISVIGVDLSEAYLDEARKLLKSRRGVRLIEGAGEKLALADASIDAAASLFVFHELPAEIRRRVAREAARVLKPGGPFVLVDSLQTGDRPQWDGILDGFERSFHEPYYRSYLEDDLETCFAAAGLALTASWTAYLSKVMVFARQG